MNIVHRIKKVLKRPKAVESLEVLEDKCVGCGQCAMLCKRAVFAMESGRAVVANLAECVGCGKCVKKMCNFAAINLVLSKTN